MDCFFVVYYKEIKRGLKRILMHECRCNERLNAKGEGSTLKAKAGGSTITPTLLLVVSTSPDHISELDFTS